MTRILRWQTLTNWWGALGAVRNMALLLRPSMLDDLGLVPALQWQGREVSKRTGLRVRITGTNTAFLREG